MLRALCLLGALGVAAGQPLQHFIDSGVWRLESQVSGTSLGTPSTKDGKQVGLIASDDGSGGQWWKVKESPGGLFVLLVNEHSGHVLSISQPEQWRSGSKLVQEKMKDSNDAGYKAQHWRLTIAARGIYTLLNRGSGMLAEVIREPDGEYIHVVQKSRANRPEQRWAATEFVETPRPPAGPTTPACESIPDNSEICEQTETTCKALARLDNTDTCGDWCGRAGLVCDAAYHDKSNTCEEKSGPKSCSKLLGNVAICACSTSSDEPLCDKFRETLSIDDDDEICAQSATTCKAVARLKKQATCDDWCARAGLRCQAAYNDKSGTCEEKGATSCGREDQGKLICDCKA